jgi:uncharacterized protein
MEDEYKKLFRLPWTLTFLLLSIVLALTSGLFFDWLVQKKVLPSNPNRLIKTETSKSFLQELNLLWNHLSFDYSFFKKLIKKGLQGSKMILRWLFLGILIAAILRLFMQGQNYGLVFGPTLLGQVLTLFFATPIAADIFTLGKAPGNCFLFLMAGVATDYTEILVLRQTTHSWKIALFLPLVTVPQIFVLATILNYLF